MKKPLKLLLVEDSLDDADLLVQALNSSGYNVTCERVETAPAMQTALEQKNWDIVISDYSMPRFSGLDALALLNESDLDIPFILVSGTVGEAVAVNAMKSGASDYLMKDNLVRLPPAVSRELAESANRAALKAKEEQLIQSQKMEVVGQLAAGVAHDLNNKLGAILMITESTKLKLEAESNLQLPLSMIQEAASFSARLVKQLLLFGRILPTNPEVLDLNKTIDASVKTLKHLIPEDFSISFQQQPMPLLVKVDPVQFDQVLFNLVLNARDAMPKGGAIEIETRITQLSEYPNTLIPAENGAYAVMRVKDSGTGIDPKNIERIFEPFFTTKPVGKGTGLGLSIIYGILKSAKGSITLESSVGKGTTFHILLPLVTEATVKAKPQASGRVESVALHAKVLLVEDDAMLRAATANVLREAKIDLTIATNANQAIELLDKAGGAFDLLLSDITMPGMSGIDLAKRVAGEYPKIGILLMTGYAADASVKLNESGVQKADIIQKPVQGAELIAKLRKLFERR